MTPAPDIQLVLVGAEPLRLDQLLAVASGRARLALDPSDAVRGRLRASAECVARLLAGGARIYGVTTGFGHSVTTSVPADLAAELPLNLLRFHGCGTGRVLEPEEAAAVVAARVASLATGYSGVRVEVVERLCELVNRRILPRIPAEGSVGASGDLTPLSYVAATLVGERTVTVDGRVVGAREALTAAGLEPLALLPKESLSLMNGTSVMSALGALAWERARRVARWAAALSAMTSDVIRGNRGHFDDRIFALKPHPGQRMAAQWIREDVGYDAAAAATPSWLQDPYSVRCAPHVIGVLVDALLSVRETLEIEINGVNDNPIVHAETDTILHGGNFYGGHVGFALDGLKVAVAHIADLLDRQLIKLCDPATSDGLPANLVGVSGPAAAAHHGFKAMSISASALTAEALKLTMPASVFSRSTEGHNQDKVPMATLAARDCLRVLELTETVCAILTLALAQAVDLRHGDRCHHRATAMRDAVRSHVGPLEGDRCMDVDIAAVLSAHQASALPIGAAELS